MFKRKLLLADDSVTIQKVINLTFADEGIEVFTVGSGTAAIEQLDEVKPDLVLADVHMPGLTGYQVCERIRQHEQFKNIPVMLLVGSFEPFDEAEARRAGANDYLTKPFQSIRQLVQKVNLLLNSEAPADVSAEVVAPSSETMQMNEVAVVEPTAVFDEEPLSRAASSATGSTNNFDNFAINDFSDDEMIETIPGGSFDNNRGNATVFDSFDPNAAANSSSAFSTATDAEPFGETAFEVVSAETDSSTAETQELDDSTYISAAEVDYGQSFQAADNSFETTVYEIQDETSNVIDESSSFVSFEEAQPIKNVEPENEATFEIVSSDQPEMYTSADAHFEVNGNQDSYEIASSEKMPELSTVAVDSEATDDEMPVLEIDLSNSDVSLIEPNDQDSVLDLQTDLISVDNEFEEEFAVENESSATETFAWQAEERSSQANGQVNLNFPPEVIDAIAQKVLEKLSDDVIEKIVMKNMPEKLEAMMRERLSKSER